MRFIRAVAVSALIALPLLVTCGEPAWAEAGKAKSIEELVKMYDSSSCRQCHAAIYKDWENSIHSRSIFGTGRTAATIKTTIEVGLKNWKASGVKKPEDVEIRHLAVCTKCHLPQLNDATDDVAKEIVKNVYVFMDGNAREKEREKAEKTLKDLNINCLVCHQRNAIIHKWVDGFPQQSEVYGSKDGAHPDTKHPALKTSPIMGESILCGQCHGLGPNFELENPSQCGTLYGSYLWAYRAEGGQESCQDCHMRKSKLGHNMQAYRDPAMTKNAVDFHVEALAYQWRDGKKMMPQTLVRVEMINRSGHSIPDG